MKRILLDFTRYADAALLVLAEAVYAALTGNAFFPALSDPGLADFKAALDAYDDALAAAADRGKNSIAAKKARKAELTNLLFKLALECMRVADGNDEALISTKFPLTKDKVPQKPLGIASISKIENGQNPGELVVTLYTLPGVRAFVYQYAQDPISESSQWHNHNSTMINETITGLESTKRYWIRIVAYGTGNQMTICEPVLSKIVQ